MLLIIGIIELLLFIRLLVWDEKTSNIEYCCTTCKFSSCKYSYIWKPSYKCLRHPFKNQEISKQKTCWLYLAGGNN